MILKMFVETNLSLYLHAHVYIYIYILEAEVRAFPFIIINKHILEAHWPSAFHYNASRKLDCHLSLRLSILEIIVVIRLYDNH